MNSSKQVIKRHLQVKTEVLVKDFMLNQDRVLNGEKVLDYTYLDTNEGVSIIADIEVDEHYGKKECMCDKANAIEPIDTYIPHATERVVAGRESPPPTAAQFAARLEKAIFGGCEDRPDDPDYDVQDLDHTPPPGASLLNSKPCDSRPRRKGWAPGDYFAICKECKCHFIGDKRAYHCADCAYADATEAKATPGIEVEVTAIDEKKLAGLIADEFIKKSGSVIDKSAYYLKLGSTEGGLVVHLIPLPGRGKQQFDVYVTMQEALGIVKANGIKPQAKRTLR